MDRKHSMVKMENKIIRDSLHGYISIPTIIFEKLIDTLIFQRLKRIEQTSMRPLYPSAHHDRFVHSLGVYYLGEKALECLIKNIKTNSYYIGKESIWEQYGLLFKIACLLHDCAHAPFSHSFEKYYIGKENSKKREDIKLELKNSLKGLEGNFDISLYEQSIDKLFENSPSPHEIYSAIIVARYFSSRIKEVCCKGYEFDVFAEHIEFIQRVILGMKYCIEKIDKTNQEKYNILNCLIQLLNSKSFDVDKLDYIMRDSAASGTNNLSVDVDRILSALTIIETHDFNEKIQIDEDINNSVMFRDLDTNIDDDRQKSEVNILLRNVKITGKIRGFLTIAEGEIREKQNKNKYKDGSEREFEEETEIAGAIDEANITGHFTGNLVSTEINDSKVDGFIKCKISGSICGRIIGIIDNWKNQGITYYEIGYKQSALSIIEDTITARNRLYMWTYAHHKVTYIDYLLRNAVLVSLLDKPQKNQLVLSDIEQDATQKMEELLDLEIFNEKAATSTNYLLDDNKFITMIINDISKNNNFSIKYLSRAKAYSVWKNYAEYNMFFNDLSLTERAKLWVLLFDKEEKQKYKEGNTQIFPSSILKDYDKDNINEFVWIKPSGYKISKISTEDTYLLFNKSVRRLKDVIISDKITEEYVDENYFYLYSSILLEYNDKLNLINFLKRKVREI